LGSGLKSINVGDHVLGIFKDEDKIDSGFDYLKDGFERKEAIMMMTDELSKEEIRNRLSQSWKINNLDELEANRSIILKTPQEMLFPQGNFQVKLNVAIWKEWTDTVREYGKSSLRIFADSSCVMKHGFVNEVHKLENALDEKFDYPCTILCAYTPDDIKKIGKEGLRKLKEHHSIVWQAEKRGESNEEQTRKCKRCGKEFQTDSDANYCSFECTYDI
jgi:hypothetical protein